MDTTFDAFVIRGRLPFISIRFPTEPIICSSVFPGLIRDFNLFAQEVGLRAGQQVIGE